MKNILIALTLLLCITHNAYAGTGHAKVRATSIPVFSSKSFLVADINGTVLKEQDIDTVRPIASISKLMVGLLASDQEMSEPLSIPIVRTVQSSIPRNIRFLTRQELLTLALVRSDNFAAQILCTNIEKCVDKMNERAAELGMQHTRYMEPTGLSIDNVSTANDLLKLLIVASNKSVLTELSSMPAAEIPVNNHSIKIRNTNPLTSKFDIILSKTGFTNPAGGCLVMIMNSAVGKRVLIILGSRNAHTRIPDMERLVKEL